MFVAIALLSGARLAAEEKSTPAAATDAAAMELSAAEHARFAAMTSGDLDALAAILGDDLVYSHSNGRTDDKTSYLQPLRSGATKYESIEPSEVKIRVFGDIGVLNGRAAFRVRNGEQRQAFNLVFTEVYQRRDGRWLLVSWQSTRLPE